MPKIPQTSSGLISLDTSVPPVAVTDAGIGLPQIAQMIEAAVGPLRDGGLTGTGGAGSGVTAAQVQVMINASLAPLIASEGQDGPCTTPAQVQTMIDAAIAPLIAQIEGIPPGLSADVVQSMIRTATLPTETRLQGIIDSLVGVLRSLGIGGKV